MIGRSRKTPTKQWMIIVDRPEFDPRDIEDQIPRRWKRILYLWWIGFVWETGPVPPFFKR
jgi:hypothetical protein